jgi:hypothetical protein
MRAFVLLLTVLAAVSGMGTAKGAALRPRLAPPPSPAKAHAPATRAKRPRSPKPKTHQATGEILSVTPTQLLLLHARGKTRQKMQFVLTPDTRKSGEVVKGARVTVYYRDIQGRRTAFRIRPARGSPAHFLPKPRKPQK